MNKYLCQQCGQIWEIARCGNFDLHPIRFCPTCGGEQLSIVKSSFISFTASCFDGIDLTLLNLLYQEWAISDDAATLQQAYPSFVDYVRAQLDS